MFERRFGTLGVFDIVIGHSLGAVFALRLLEHLMEPIRAAFLVSAFVSPIRFTPYSEMIASFFASEFDWTRIREMSRAWHIYHGDDDPIVPLASALAVARNLDLTMSLIPDGGTSTLQPVLSGLTRCSTISWKTVDRVGPKPPWLRKPTVAYSMTGCPLNHQVPIGLRADGAPAGCLNQARLVCLEPSRERRSPSSLSFWSFERRAIKRL